MKTRLALLSLLAFLGCNRSESEATPATPSALAASSAPAASHSAAPVASPGAAPSPAASPSQSAGTFAVAPAMSDQEFGALLQSLSEEGGKFPSDNYVSNETSFLHVTEALEKLHGGAYIGVGPEQSFTYLAMIEPEMSFLIDIRRDNMIMHLIYKVLFESSPTRAEFLARLTSRPTPSLPPDAPIEQITKALQSSTRDLAMEARTRKEVAARAEATGLKLRGSDRKHLQESLAAFAKEGIGIHYTMEGSARDYPSLGELMATKDDAGKQRSFLATEGLYQRVRAMQQANRVIPVVGDLAGKGAVPRIAEELKKRKLPLRVFYVSNVEQYLFSPSATWNQWIKNLHAMPWADDGLILRVYFDQGRAHPKQRPGHRTTSMTQPAAAFLERADKGGWKSWWEVVQ